MIAGVAFAVSAFFAVGGANSDDTTSRFDLRSEAATELTAIHAFSDGLRALRENDVPGALSALQYSAEGGHVGAMWKLARIYSDGILVDLDIGRAVGFYEQIIVRHGNIGRFDRFARLVSDSMVALGRLHTTDGFEPDVSYDPRRAAGLLRHAATFFGDPNAQYELALLYIDGTAGEQSPTMAARWLTLAARKDHKGAQTLLGEMLWKGEGIKRRPVQGLTWMMLANGSSEEGSDGWSFADMEADMFADADPSDIALAEERARALRQRIDERY